MPTFYDSKGQSYDLINQIGRGGEGTVFACPGDSSLVAKIYHAPVDAEKAEKLRWMADNKNEQLLKVAAWIVDTLTDADGTTAGFLMPNVKAKEIHELYSLKSRRVHFPDATWKFLIHTATNVARAFYNLHKSAHIMGDVNHGNCVVLRDGTVKLIDCDSYSISKGDFRYRCEVGVATHLAPELQGVDLGEVERENKHDNFGLAVIIFQLLFLGRHPFSGNYLGNEDKSLEDCIRERRFAYGADAHLWNVKQPPGTLALSAVTPRLSAMFERAFLTDDRPEPREWIEALEDLSESLKQCALHIGHFYFQDLSSCPWCELESKTGLMLFPFINSNRTAEDGEFNIFTVENLVSSLAVPNALPAKLPKTSVLPPPSPEAETARRENVSRFITFAVVQFAVVVFLTAIAGSGVGFFVGAILMAGFIVSLNNAGKNSKIDLEVRLEGARRDWEKLEAEWSSFNVAPNFKDDLALVRRKINEHHQLQQQTREQVKLLRGEVHNYKLEVFLASFKIGDAKIAGVEKQKLELLKTFGIRSAADIDTNRFKSIPPIFNGSRDKLIEWRENLERQFVYDPNAEIPEADQKRLTESFTVKRGGIEREIENLLVSLRSNSTIIKQRQQFLSTRAEAVSKLLVQSESDMAAAGNTTLPIIALILITALVPMIGNAMFNTSRPEVTSYKYSSGYSEPQIKVKPAAPRSMDSNESSVENYNFIISENLNDEQIEYLSEDEKAIGAQQLLDRSKGNMNVKNYTKAEQQLRLAVKLSPNNVEILNKLGNVLYEEKNYQDSVAFLKRSLNLEPNFAETKFSLGVSYLKLKYYQDAQRVFGDLVNQNPRSFEANFDLGQAYKGMDDYDAAVAAFQTATEIKPNDADAHYEYAICLNKVGSQADVMNEYSKLLDINAKMAEKLRKDLKLKYALKYAQE